MKKIQFRDNRGSITVNHVDEEELLKQAIALIRGKLQAAIPIAGPFLFVTVTLLVLAPFIRPPIGYFMFLRIIVTLSMLYIAAASRFSIVMVPIAIAGAILFNPVWQVWLNRQLWLYIDFVTAGFIVIAYIILVWPTDNGFFNKEISS